MSKDFQVLTQNGGSSFQVGLLSIIPHRGDALTSLAIALFFVQASSRCSSSRRCFTFHCHAPAFLSLDTEVFETIAERKTRSRPCLIITLVTSERLKDGKIVCILCSLWKYLQKHTEKITHLSLFLQFNTRRVRICYYNNFVRKYLYILHERIIY